MSWDELSHAGLVVRNATPRSDPQAERRAKMTKGDAIASPFAPEGVRALLMRAPVSSFETLTEHEQGRWYAHRP